MNAPLPVLTTHVLVGAVDRLDAVLVRLASFVDSEAASLAQLARILGLPEIPELLRRLEGLHHVGLEASDACVVEEAEVILADLLAALQAIPVSAEPVGTILPGDGAFIRDLDRAVCWLGARVDDQHRAVVRLAR